MVLICEKLHLNRGAKRLLFLALNALFIVVYSNHAMAQTFKSQMSIEPNRVISGKTVTLTYNTSEGPLKGAKKVYALAYTFEDYRWKIADVIMEKGDSGKWYGQLHFPEQASLIALKFQDSLLLDPLLADAGEHNVSSLRDSQNNVKPGCRIGFVMLMKPSYHLGIDGYFSKTYQEISQKWAELNYGVELQANPQEANKFFKAIKEITIGHYADSTAVQQHNALMDLANVLNSTEQKTEEDLINLYELFLNDLHDNIRADSIEQILCENYPKNRIRRNKALLHLCSLSGKEFYVAAENFRNEFPVREWRNDSPKDGNDYFIFYNKLIAKLLDDKKISHIAEILPEMDFETIYEQLYNNVMLPAKYKGKNKKQKVIALMKESLNKKIGETVNFSGKLLSPMQALYLHTQQLEKINNFKTY